MKLKFKGTPGKWHASQNPHYLDIRQHDFRFEDPSDSDPAIASINENPYTSPPTGLEEQKYNAYLIAESKNLLEALQDCINAMENGDPNEETTRTVWDYILINAYSVINKALGL